jgi:hypothetical protein
MNSTFRGITSDRSSEYENRFNSIHINHDCDSNQIDCSDENENAENSIHVSRESDSNEINESDSQCEKDDEQRM